MKNSRRHFLKSTGIAIGGALLLPSCYHEPAPFRFFTQAEADCLNALCECIIPSDDAPGATDAGVIYYIDKQLMGHFRNYQRDYHKGIESLQKDCGTVMGTLFEQLNPQKQNEFLEMLEQSDGQLKNWHSPGPQEFFNMVVNHTMQGFYGAPRHGGNKDYVSYQMLGIGYPQVVGQNRYGKGDSNG